MKTFELLAASALVSLCACPATAQDRSPPFPAQDARVTLAQAGVSAAPPAGPINDDAGGIIVTATKRKQTPRNVQVSVAATREDTVKQARILGLISLQSCGQTGFSVSDFIGRVDRSRVAAAIADLPDFERIEALRGARSTRFGKNGSADAVSIVIKRPQVRGGGSTGATTGNFGNIETRAALTRPISTISTKCVAPRSPTIDCLPTR